MNEDISRLMDGEVDDEQAVERVCAGCRQPAVMATWACYHVIGDALRGHDTASPGFGMRFAAALANEPTVLAPVHAAPRRTSYAWAAAAAVAAMAVVGWTALSLTDSPSDVIAKAREGASVRSASVRTQQLPPDYLLAHQEFSPSTALQGGQYMRAVADAAVETRP